MSDLFDEEYWAQVEGYGNTCDICGNKIREDSDSWTGWTHHSERWQGMRCEGGVTGPPRPASQSAMP